ncbi:MAG TPA: DoxX family protein [Silvibacterium sp.]|nr:DoxX family protein [Silvibacterium sp.]
MFSSFERIRPLSALIARLVLGTIMVVHGAQKVFPRGSLYQFVQFVGHLGLPYWLGYVAAFTELFGGALLILGLLVHLAALAVAIDMAVAIVKVHLHHGLTGPQGFEFPLALFALAVVLIGTGPGFIAVDGYVFRGRGAVRG